MRKIGHLNEKDLKAYIMRVLDNLSTEQIADLKERRFVYSFKIEQKISDYEYKSIKESELGFPENLLPFGEMRSNLEYKKRITAEQKFKAIERNLKEEIADERAAIARLRNQ